MSRGEIGWVWDIQGQVAGKVGWARSYRAWEPEKMSLGATGKHGRCVSR